MTFCTDTDLLYWEPELPREAAFASQTQISGTGDLAGSSFTLTAGGSFTESNVAPTQVLILSGGALAGCFPIVTVDSATELTISALHGELFSGDQVAAPIPVGTSANQGFAIRTFWPQRRVVSDLLLAASGLDPAEADAAQKVVNPAALRRPAALGTLHMIYAALAAASPEPAIPAARADFYERLYRRALRATVVQLDLDGDGHADASRPLNVLLLRRD